MDKPIVNFWGRCPACGGSLNKFTTRLDRSNDEKVDYRKVDKFSGQCSGCGRNLVVKYKDKPKDLRNHNDYEIAIDLKVDE